jgi:UDP-N-acetylmuramoyl-L-alanyl-D-glutamate--2,6-diaminopimelate ligase
LNKDDDSYDYLAGISQARQLSYSLEEGADLWADEIENTPSELRFRVHGPGKTFTIRTALIGRYNVSNSLAALGLTVFGLGIPVETAQKAYENMPVVPGRMEALEMGQDFLAIVDFAHTPNGIRQALSTAREMTQGRLIAVFGSAGLRDVEKRKMMPEIATGIADELFLTAEDPRTESLEQILADMAEGAQRAGGVEGETFWREPDRGTAIRKAVARAQKGDMVIVCGKGHEQSMCFGTVEYPWDDRTALKSALADLLNVAGPEMPVLPTSPGA